MQPACIIPCPIGDDRIFGEDVFQLANHFFQLDIPRCGIRYLPIVITFLGCDRGLLFDAFRQFRGNGDEIGCFAGQSDLRAVNAPDFIGISMYMNEDCVGLDYQTGYSRLLSFPPTERQGPERSPNF